MSSEDEKANGEVVSEAGVTVEQDETLNFDQWSVEMGLTRKTTALLRKEDLGSLDTLCLLDNSDLLSLDLSVGQRKVLAAAISKIKAEKQKNIDCSEAAGAYYNGECLYTKWKSVMPWADSLHINFKEVLALEPAVHQWAPYWCNKKVFVHCDNQAAVSIINKGSCNNSVVMNSLRTVFWLSVMYNFRLKAVYYAGRFNKIADSVSRLHEPGGLSRLYKCFIF